MYLQKAKSLLAKKEEGNKEFRAGNYHEAYKKYTEALEIDPNNKFTNSKLYCNRATVCSKVSTFLVRVKFLRFWYLGQIKKDLCVGLPNRN